MLVEIGYTYMCFFPPVKGINHPVRDAVVGGTQECFDL